MVRGHFQDAVVSAGAEALLSHGAFELRSQSTESGQVARLWREDIWAFFSRDEAKRSSCFWRVRRTRSRNLGRGFGISAAAALSWLHTPPFICPRWRGGEQRR